MLRHISYAQVGSLQLEILNSDGDDNFVVRYGKKGKALLGKFRYDLQPAAAIVEAINTAAGEVDWFGSERVYQCSKTKALSVLMPDGDCQTWQIPTTNKKVLRFVNDNREEVTAQIQSELRDMFDRQLSSTVFSHFADASAGDNSFPVDRERSNREIERSLDDPLAIHLSIKLGLANLQNMLKEPQQAVANSGLKFG